MKIIVMQWWKYTGYRDNSASHDDVAHGSEGTTFGNPTNLLQKMSHKLPNSFSTPEQVHRWATIQPQLVAVHLTWWAEAGLWQWIHTLLFIYCGCQFVQWAETGLWLSILTGELRLACGKEYIPYKVCSHWLWLSIRPVSWNWVVAVYSSWWAENGLWLSISPGELRLACSCPFLLESWRDWFVTVHFSWRAETDLWLFISPGDLRLVCGC